MIDGNVDSLVENPMVPSSVNVAPYWGPITETPADRRSREKKQVPDTKKVLDMADVVNDLAGV